MRPDADSVYDLLAGAVVSRESAAVTSWTLHLPMNRPLSLNGREHWRVKADKTAQVRRAVIVLARVEQVPRMQRASVVLHYVPRDRRRRDALNLVATLKACEDGIVDARCLPDDCEPWLTPSMPVLDPPERDRTSRLYVVVTDLTGDTS